VGVRVGLINSPYCKTKRHHSAHIAYLWLSCGYDHSNFNVLYCSGVEHIPVVILVSCHVDSLMFL